MPSKPNILIVGPSGSGKSSSLENLFTGPRAKEVAYLDLERKGLPFLCDTSKLGYFAECEDMFKTEEHMKKAYKIEGVKFIVYDSLGKYLDYVRSWSQGMGGGWDVWNRYNQKIDQFIEFNKATGKVTISVLHDEVVQMDTPEGGKVSRLRASVGAGKQWEGKIEKEFLIVLFSFAKREGQGMKYFFQTNSDGLSSAKTPKWLELPPNAPNDLLPVINKLVEKNLV